MDTFWDPLGSSFGPFGALLDHFGTLLGLLWDLLGPSWGSLVSSWSPEGHKKVPGDHLGAWRHNFIWILGGIVVDLVRFWFKNGARNIIFFLTLFS